MILDAAKMGSREEAHAYLQAQLQLPEYCGSNLDALYDCLTEYGELEVQFVNTEAAHSYFDKVLRVFRDAALENENLSIAE